eukprot:GHRR01009893.1.p2 GENE.GHRR01009893.1~~GHRR01009893.1.p2  ORF type:complete len:191 (+),score=19.94 GHRR01009893.1:70-573(+)
MTAYVPFSKYVPLLVTSLLHQSTMANYILVHVNPEQPSETAFCCLNVPFSRQQLVATLAAASLHSYDETAWTINPAPAPQEIVWSNCGLRAWELSVRQLAVWAAFWVVVLFYAPVVALIQAPVNMDNLKKVGSVVVCNLKFHVLNTLYKQAGHLQPWLYCCFAATVH